MTGHIATATVEIDAPQGRVWAALTDPEQIRRYMFDTVVETDWRVGAAITWSGEFDGKTYQDKGQILEFEPTTLLKLTHFSPLTGQPDVPENYHTITFQLGDQGQRTVLTLSQDNNATAEEAEHSANTWRTMLANLKNVVENPNP